MDNYQQENARQNMYSILKDHIENIENINLNEIIGNSSDPMGQIQNMVHFLSNVSNKNNMHSIRQLCEHQEQKVFIKLREIKEYDLYDEMSRLNSELNLKNLSMNQLTNKWTELQEKIKIENEEDTGKNNIKIEQEDECQMSNQYSNVDNFENIQNIEEENDDSKSLSEAELTTHFFKKLSDMSKHNSINKKPVNKDFSENQHYFDCNLLQNLMLDDFGTSHTRQGKQRNNQKESWGNILREIDMNDEGFNCQYLDDI